MSAPAVTVDTFFADVDRYAFDFDICARGKGWAQLDTAQDASYFGHWLNPTARQLIAYVEGDITRTTCATDEAFAAEVRKSLAWFEKHDGKPATIDTLMCADIAAAFIAAGLGDVIDRPARVAA